MANRTGKKSINRREKVPGFEDRLKGLRGKVPSAAIAKDLGYVPGTYGAWENGTRQPGLVELVKICQHFNCSTDYLLGLSPERTQAATNVIGDNNHHIDTVHNASCADCPMSKTIAQQAETIANLSRALAKT